MVGIATFKLATRSAVSSKVSFPIWSTMVVILGSEGACVLASVLDHRREQGDLCCRRREEASDVVDERRRHCDGE